jgi:hypothetical protein
LIWFHLIYRIFYFNDLYTILSEIIDLFY